MRGVIGVVVFFSLACGGFAPTDAPTTLSGPVIKTTAKTNPGTVRGVCQRMSDCGCSMWASVDACEAILVDVHDEATPAELTAMANAECRFVCAKPDFDMKFDVGADGSVRTELRIRDDAGTDVQMGMEASEDGARIGFEDNSDY